MKAGRLFENALKVAQLNLKPGTEIRVLVQGKGERIRLVVQSFKVSEFEAAILERSKRAVEGDLIAYKPRMPVGSRIRTIRKAAGLTLDTVASKAKISKGSLCSIEKGERSVGLSVLRKLARALGVSISVLLN